MPSLKPLYTQGLIGLDELIKEYKSGHKVVKASAAHIPYLCEHIRIPDLIEIMCFGDTPENVFTEAIKESDENMTVLTPDNKPMAMFGAGRAGDGDCYIWLLGTTDIDKHDMFFMRHSREWVWGFVGIYEKVYNHVHVENHKAIKWLKWCKAEFEYEVDVYGHQFKKFIIEKDKI